VLLIEGVVKLFEAVARAVPPVAAAYQFIVCPLPGVAEMVTVPVPQRAAEVPAGAAGIAFTVATTAVRVETHPVVVLRASA
jgi:hypothetical protein